MAGAGIVNLDEELRRPMQVHMASDDEECEVIGDEGIASPVGGQAQDQGGVSRPGPPDPEGGQQQQPPQELPVGVGGEGEAGGGEAAPSPAGARRQVLQVSAANQFLTSTAAAQQPQQPQPQQQQQQQPVPEDGGYAPMDGAATAIRPAKRESDNGPTSPPKTARGEGLGTTASYELSNKDIMLVLQNLSG